MSQANPSADLEQSLTMLETRLARYRHSVIALTVIVLASGLLFGQDRTQQRIRDLGIEGQIAVPDQAHPPLVVRDSITLADPAGEERAILTATSNGASLVLSDATGDVRVGIDAGYTPSVTLYDGNLRARAILAARGGSLEGRAQGSSGCRREVRSGTMFFHRDRRGTKPAARTPLRPKGYGETGPSSLSPTPPNECALSLLRGFGPAPRRLLESGPVWP